LIAGLLIAGLACALLEFAWIIAQHRQDRGHRTRRLAWRNPDAVSVTASPDS
jgi:hypothetical protein